MNELALPKVSVLITSKSPNHFFVEALRSISAQTFCDYEIIIIVENYYEKFKSYLTEVIFPSNINIRLIQVQISGFGFCINYGLNIARGEYIARMDADDLIAPDRFHIQVDFLDNNQDYSIVGSRSMAIDERGERLSKFNLPFYQDDSIIKSVLPFRNPLYHSSLMIRRSIFLKFGGYRYDFYAQDHEMWIRLSLTGEVKFHNVDKVLYYYRRNSLQETNILNSKRAYYEISSFLYKFYLQTKNLKFIFGMIVVHPFSRQILSIYRKVKFNLS